MKHLAKAVFIVGMILGYGQALAAEEGHMAGQQPAEFNQAYMKAMDQMHGPMMTGIMDADPDAAFVKGMIPHHRGAVAMAEIELKYGTDPELKKLARDIIAAQDKEIAFMEAWLKKRPAK